MIGEINHEKIGVASLMVCSILASTSVLAVWVDGGQWNSGVGWSGNFGYSDYLHSTRSHTATVKDGNKFSKDRAEAEAWARASIFKFPPTGMEYFYGF
ncbi:TPA: lactococcin 972 family bacteriocin [Streptococcus pneumoniae]|nr:lactococcin 972 family bacteriocin [Streptococcus pneumoniae]